MSFANDVSLSSPDVDDVFIDDNYGLADDPSWWHEAHYWHTLNTMADIAITYGVDNVMFELKNLIAQKSTYNV